MTRLALSASLGIVTLAVVASPSRADKAAAEAAFERAQELAKQGRWVEACPLFEASFKEDPAVGAELNLANCHEHVGKLATAWAEYGEVALKAARLGDATREQFAKDHADALAPRLTKLRLVAPQAIDGLAVRRDGEDVTSLLGLDVPVDPGAHVIEAAAPGHDPWKVSVAVEGEGKTVEQQIPELAVTKPPPEQPKPAMVVTVPGAPPAATTIVVREDLAATRHSRHVTGATLAAVGIAGLVVGGVFGELASSAWSTAQKDCNNDTANCPGASAMKAQSEVNSAKTSALVSTIAVSAGGVVLAVGAIVFLSAPGDERPATAWRVVPAVTPSAIGVTLARGW